MLKFVLWQPSSLFPVHLLPPTAKMSLPKETGWRGTGQENPGKKIKVELGKVKARQQRLPKSKTEYENHMSGYFLQKVIGWEEEGTFLNRWITKCVLGGRVKRGILDFDYLQNLSTTARECRSSQQFGDKEQSDSPNPQDRSAFVLQNQTYLHLPWMQDSKRKFRGKPLRNGRA